MCHTPHLIFQALSQQMNCSLNKNNEQMFIHLRLQLFDRQYRLDVDRHLWESYLDLGCKEKFWPVSCFWYIEDKNSSTYHLMDFSLIHFLAPIIYNGED